MIRKTYNWKHPKGYDLFAQSWERSDRPRAVIGIIHGQSDHGSRFTHVADYFTTHHYAVMAMDLPGHGKSGGKRGHMDTIDDYLDAIAIMQNAMHAWYPKAPFFLYGHSMGGSVVLNYLIKQNPKNIAGVIITSPLLRIAFVPPAWRVILGKVVRSIYPALLQPTGLDVAKLTRVEAVNQAYAKDPLVHGKISVSAYFEIMEHGENVLKDADKLRVPVFLAHGSGDQLTSHEASRELANKRKDIITYKEFEGLYHEMHNEETQQDLFNEIYNWLQLHTSN